MFLPSRHFYRGGDVLSQHSEGGVLGKVKHAMVIRGGQDFFLAVTTGEVFVNMIIKISLEGCKEGEKSIP